jgi:hypothetical protein
MTRSILKYLNEFDFNDFMYELPPIARDSIRGIKRKLDDFEDKYITQKSEKEITARKNFEDYQKEAFEKYKEDPLKYSVDRSKPPKREIIKSGEPKEEYDVHEI